MTGEERGLRAAMAKASVSRRAAHCSVAGRDATVEVVGRYSSSRLLYRVEIPTPPARRWEGHMGATLQALASLTGGGPRA